LATAKQESSGKPVEVVPVDICDIPEIIHYFHNTGEEGAADQVDLKRRIATFRVTGHEARTFPDGRMKDIDTIHLVYTGRTGK
jgi:hypothetical protein